MTLQRISLFALAMLTIVACDTATDADEGRSLELNISGLETLANGFHYEGWAIVDGQPVTTGKFNVDANGSYVDLSGRAISSTFDVDQDISTASAIVLTIEPAGDTDAIPAVTKYMGGDLRSGSASLSVAHGSSLGDNYTNAAGTYILGTPTDGPNSDETSGIWFLDLSTGMPTTGLDLPTLPDGWAYEGWVVIDGNTVSTGTFTSADGPDNAAPFSGPEPAPSFPGEDFLLNAPDGLTFPLDLSGRTAVISIEPMPDDTPAPFTLKPLAGPIPNAAEAFTSYMIGNNASSFPTGSASIR
ncbi:MAG: anti-sigma factor [Bacteroidota bacterium]